MFGTLKKLLNKNDTREAEREDPPLNSNPNFLTDPKKINILLQEIEEESPLCTISFKDKSEEFSSSILDIQLENKKIIIDELLPKHGNDYISPESTLKLSTIHNGIRLAFQLNNIKQGSSRGIAFYKADIPNRIYYPQRRSSPRIQLTSLNIPFSGTSQGTQLYIRGYIFDISRGGIGVVLQNNKARIQRGDLIKNCQIILDESAVTFDLTARFIKNSSGSEKIQIGGYFDNLSSKHQKKLERFVATLEREEIRKRKDN